MLRRVNLWPGRRHRHLHAYPRSVGHAHAHAVPNTASPRYANADVNAVLRAELHLIAGCGIVAACTTVVL